MKFGSEAKCYLEACKVKFGSEAKCDLEACKVKFGSGTEYALFRNTALLGHRSGEYKCVVFTTRHVAMITNYGTAVIDIFGVFIICLQWNLVAFIMISSHTS